MKSKKTASILALIFGGIGIHRFYLGQTAKGVFSIIFCWTYIPMIIGVIDFFIFQFWEKNFLILNIIKKQKYNVLAVKIHCPKKLFHFGIS